MPKSLTKRKDNLVVKAGECEIWFPFGVLPHISCVTLGKSWTVTYLSAADLHVKQTEPSWLCRAVEMLGLLVHMTNTEMTRRKVLEMHKLPAVVLSHSNKHRGWSVLSQKTVSKEVKWPLRTEQRQQQIQAGRWKRATQYQRARGGTRVSNLSAAIVSLLPGLLLSQRTMFEKDRAG